ncbi:hypothetical protein KDM87_08535 [Undibacterium sp. FT147W]|uniref:Agglutinin domain-containing protein n=1 Tax=Undibacterium rivi TaxID=2828729 RepID=A0ABS5H1R0_9BURK|nr:hypothetical protein [Undibacterium rivi]MBR7792638.1 hypothetical protein [Undibacterium rivi]
MSEYLRLFTVYVRHDFFDQGAGTHIRFEPTKECALFMQRENILLRKCPDGAEIWLETRDVENNRTRTEKWNFSFAAFSDDPLMNFYTVWPIPLPLCFKNSPAMTDGVSELLQAEEMVNENAAKKNAYVSTKEPLFQVSITDDFSVNTRKIDAREFRIQLEARPIHWKYFFSGALASRKLKIIDLNSSNEGEGIRFIPSSQVVSKTSVAFVSEAALPMRSIPSQRFQLCEEGVTGKVLMKRLPNANVQHIGKERRPDGHSFVVAEIYIHQ